MSFCALALASLLACSGDRDEREDHPPPPADPTGTSEGTGATGVQTDTGTRDTAGGSPTGASAATGASGPTSATGGTAHTAFGTAGTGGSGTTGHTGGGDSGSDSVSDTGSDSVTDTGSDSVHSANHSADSGVTIGPDGCLQGLGAVCVDKPAGIATGLSGTSCVFDDAPDSGHAPGYFASDGANQVGVWQAGVLVADVCVDEEGYWEVSLPPGDYIVCTESQYEDTGVVHSGIFNDDPCDTVTVIGVKKCYWYGGQTGRMECY